ncbi:unnamed protein product [Brassica oleracea]
MILSTVKEEKLAALLGRWLIFEIEIWITNKIEPDAVSWSNFFRVGVMRHNEILSRVPVKSIRAVRSTCKNWNLITKYERFANKHIDKATASERDKEFLVIAGDYLFSLNLNETHNRKFDLSINHRGISIAREHSDRTVFIAQAFLSQGLLLCVWRNVIDNRSRLLVWNPYWGKNRWIECPMTYCLYEWFAFGYDKSSGRHKILRFSSNNGDRYMEIYDLSSDSWRTLDAASDINTIKYMESGLSLKGNTYWYAIDYETEDCFLHYFDFTRERFENRLPLPQPPSSYSYAQVNISLSSVKEEKLAVLFSPRGRFVIDIWVTNKTEPDAVSWSYFFKVETTQHLSGFLFENFLIDEEKKVIVIFDIYGGANNAYTISGETGHFRKLDLRQSPYKRPYRLVGCYIPSSVQI